MRLAIDTFLVEFSGDLQTDPDTMKRAEQVKHQVLEHPEVRNVIGSAWGTAKRMLLDAAEDPSSELRMRVRDGLVAPGQAAGRRGRAARQGRHVGRGRGRLRGAQLLAPRSPR